MMSYTAWYLARIYIYAAFDLTGRFPQRFSQGNQYILVGYHFDENYITGIPLESRAAAVITEAWKKMHQVQLDIFLEQSNFPENNRIFPAGRPAFRTEKR